MNTARSQLRPVPSGGEDPSPTFADQVRDAVASRSQRMEERNPAALDLEARLLVALHAELHGVASSLAWPMAPEHFREALRGLRSLPVWKLCQLAVSPRPDAGRALDAVLAVLAGARRIEAQQVSLSEAVAQLSSEANDVAVEMLRARADGHVDAGELDRLERELLDTERACRKLGARIDEARREGGR